MTEPHIHHDCIVAWAKGATIQYWRDPYGWADCSGNDPAWCTDAEYRVKPEAKPDITFYGRAVLTYFDTPPIVGGLGNMQGSLDNLKLTFDGETGKLKSVEVL